MKSVKQLFVLLFVVTLTFNLTYAQDDQPKMFIVHTDNVNFDMMQQYEEMSQKMKAMFVKHNVQDMSWTTVSIEDGRYVHVSPIENMADLDKNPMAAVFEKEGDEVQKMFEKMDECYDSHSNSIVHYVSDLSYNPEGYSTKDMNDREYHFLYYSPKNGKAIQEAMKKVKALFTEKGVKNGYSVFHSGFGSEESYYMVSVAGKDAVHIAMTGKENDEALGDERKAVFFNLIQLTSRYDQVNGQIRPDLSYYPKTEE
ncbi:hypothetical protein [uncultured Psychroserpens sp.]|uniref:hypothetical protein n=1 Tax=uncultured Psychroserpens sp. TaxID=255436 RepID=UPI00260D0F1B|nr:hypothetical protein [uncultured Psychroserpens sp.]